MDPNSTPPIRDAWYYALPGTALERGQMLAKTMLGEPVLLGQGRCRLRAARYLPASRNSPALRQVRRL
jgi:hypothetical protein